MPSSDLPLKIISNNSADDFDTHSELSCRDFSKPTITAIKPAVNNYNRANIFINEKFEFSLDLSQIVDFHLKVGQTLDEKKISELKHASEFGKLYQNTLEWVLTRPRSIRETRDHLRQKLKKRQAMNQQALRNREKLKSETAEERFIRKDREERFGGYLRTRQLTLFSEEDIEEVINRLIAKNYLNDYNFAKYYIENRNVKKGTSKKRLSLELAKKGIDRSVIDELLSENLRDDEEEIKKIIAKKRSRYDEQKLINYLVRQGFDYQLVQSAVRSQLSSVPEMD